MSIRFGEYLGSKSKQMNDIELVTSRVCHSKKRGVFHYDTSLTGHQLIPLVMKNLKCTNENGDFTLMLKKADGDLSFMNMDGSLASNGVLPTSQILLIKFKIGVKILTINEAQRAVTIDLSVPIMSQLGYVADKLMLNCQYEQYTFFEIEPRSGIAKPLDPALPVAVQTFNYKRLLFKRRVFLIFLDQMSQIDSAIHVYRDIKENYLKNMLLKCSYEESMRAAWLIIFAEMKNSGEMKKNKIVIDNIGDCFSKSVELPKTFKEDLKEFIQKSGFVNRLVAMKEFAKLVRKFTGFGCEQFSGKYLVTKDKIVDSSIVVGPHGIRITKHGEESTELFSTSMFRIVSFKTNRGNFSLRYLNSETHNVEKVRFHVSKSASFKSLLKSCLDALGRRNRMLRSPTGICERVMPDEMLMINGEYRTLFDAEEAIRIFVGRFDDMKARNIEQQRSEEDEASSEIAEISKLVKCKSRFFNLVTSYLPQYASQLVNVESILKRADVIGEEMQEAGRMVHRMNLDGIRSFACFSLDFVDLIQSTSFVSDLSIIQPIRSRIECLIVLAKESEDRGQSLSEISPNVIEMMRILVNNDLPCFKENFQKLVNDLAKPKRLSDELKSRIPKGTVTLLAIEHQLNEVIDILFAHRNEISADFDSCHQLAKILWQHVICVHSLFEDYYRSPKIDLRERVDKLRTMFVKLNDFSFTVRNSRKIESNVRAKCAKSITRLLKLFELLAKLTRCDDRREFFHYPGSTKRMFDGIEATQEMIQTFKSLSKSKTYKNNASLQPDFRKCVDILQSAENKLIPHLQKLKENNREENERIEAIQEYQQLKESMRVMHAKISQQQESIDLSQAMASFFARIDASIYTMTSWNLNHRRAESIERSIELLIDAMKCQEVDVKLVDRLERAKSALQGHQSRLRVSPTDGNELKSLHELLINLLNDIQSISHFLSLGDHRTIPLIIELMIPLITDSLTDPIIDDEYERCSHILAFNQAQCDVALLINSILRYLNKPTIIDQSDLKRRVSSLGSVFVDLTAARTDLMKNPFSFAVMRKIISLFNQAKIIEANMIRGVMKIDDFLWTDSLKAVLANSMKSVNQFEISVIEMNIRPFRHKPSKEKILSFRDSLIKLASVLKEMVLDASADENPIVFREERFVMSVITNISKNLEKSPHSFFKILMFDLEPYLDGINLRLGRINSPHLVSIENIVRSINNDSAKLIDGEEASVSKFIDLFKSTSDVISEIVESETSSSDIMKPVSNYFVEMLNMNDFSQRNMKIIKFAVLSMIRSLSCCDDKVFELLEEVANFIRQIVDPTVVDLNMTRIEVSESEDIDELSVIILSNLRVLSSAFKEFSIHPVVTKSNGIEYFVSQFFKFFFGHFKYLDSRKDDIELNIGRFCREIKPTLDLVINDVRTLHPILSSSVLVDSCVSFGENVERVIFMISHNNFSFESATRFMRKEFNYVDEVRDLLLSVAEDPFTADNEELSNFVQGTLELINDLPSDLTSIKPKKAKYFMNKLYSMFSESIPKIQSDIDCSGIGFKLSQMMNRLSKYASLERTEIKMTSNLIASNKIVSPRSLKIMHDETNIDSLTEMLNNGFSKISSSIDSLPSHLRFANMIISPRFKEDSKKNIVEALDALRIVTCSCSQIEQVESGLKSISMKASAIANNILIKMKNLDSQIDSLIDDVYQITSYQSVIMNYSTYHKISTLIPLIKMNDEENKTICEQFVGLIYQTDMALTSCFMLEIDHLVHYLEEMNQEERFVEQTVPILKSRMRSILLDHRSISKLTELYEEYRTNKSHEIIRMSKRDDRYQRLQQSISSIDNNFGPLFSQWTNVGESDLSTALRSVLETSTKHLNEFNFKMIENKSMIPSHFAKLYSEITQILHFTDIAKTYEMNVDKFIPLIKNANNICSQCERVIIGSATSRTNLEQIMPMVEKAIKNLSESITPVTVVPSKIEDKNKLEKNIPSVIELPDLQGLFQDIIKSMDDAKGSGH